MTADDVRAAMGWQQRHPALAARCPHCGAGVGQRCTTRSGKRPIAQPHPARIQADPPLPPGAVEPPPTADTQSHSAC